VSRATRAYSQDCNRAHLFAWMKSYQSWFSAPPAKPLTLVERRGVTMDLFDARHLLDRDPPPPVGHETRLDSRLDGERFSDLWDAQDTAARQEEEMQQRKRQKKEKDEQQPNEAVVDTPDVLVTAPVPPLFDVPFEVPRGMLVPTVEKQHSVIWTLVSFVLKQGLEVVESVRLRQSGNPLFDFLNPADTLHAYFEHLLNGAQSSTLRDAPQLRFWREVPTVGRTGLSALLGSEEAVQRQIVEKMASFVREYGAEVVAKIVRTAPSPDERRLDFLAPDHALHEYYCSLIAPPPPPPKTEEELAERRRRAAALIQAAGLQLS
jgi:hypothetical protein